MLGEICSYDWKEQHVIPKPCELPNVSRLEPDCQLLAPEVRDPSLTPELDEDQSFAEESWSGFEQAYFDALRAPQWDLASWSGVADRSSTVLAVVDAEPLYPGGTHPALAGSVQHGNYFMALAREIGGCSTGSCALHWRSYRALYPTAKTVAGSIFDAAIQVHRALRAAARREDDHLVISLGMAFDLDPSCAMSENSLALEALREILGVAVCEHDAISLAPVGNHLLGELGQGVMYPAALEKEVAACEPHRPLVVSVSGVDYDLDPLASSRARGTLQTLGGPYASVAERLAPRSGSSIATAAAGAIVALAWSFRPDLDAEELLSLISTAAEERAGVVGACDALVAVCAAVRSDRCMLQAQLCGRRPDSSTNALAELLLSSEWPEPGDALDELPTGEATKPALEPICLSALGARGGGSGPDEYKVTLFPEGAGQVLGPDATDDAPTTFLELRYGADSAYYGVNQSIQFTYDDSLAGVYWWSGSQSYVADVLDLR